MGAESICQGQVGEGVLLRFQGEVVKKRESPDFRSPEVGISVVKPDWLINLFP